MNQTLDYLKSSRKWLVPNILVWGNADACRPKMVMTEDGAFKRLVFASTVIGGRDQAVSFSDLIDSRGNKLPSQIVNPVVMIIPRNSTHCFVLGRPSSTGFKIAKASLPEGVSQEGLVDLLIMEVDLP